MVILCQKFEKKKKNSKIPRAHAVTIKCLLCVASRWKIQRRSAFHYQRQQNLTFEELQQENVRQVCLVDDLIHCINCVKMWQILTWIPEITLGVFHQFLTAKHLIRAAYNWSHNKGTTYVKLCVIQCWFTKMFHWWKDWHNQPIKKKSTILKQDGTSSWVLGHNVYSVVLFQLIGTILSAFVRLKKSYHYSHPCSQNVSQVVYTPPFVYTSATCSPWASTFPNGRHFEGLKHLWIYIYIYLYIFSYTNKQLDSRGQVSKTERKNTRNSVNNMMWPWWRGVGMRRRWE